MKKIIIYTLCLFLVACTGKPENVQPVSPFQLEKYLGKWYEVARLDHSFEQGLEQVSAEYSMNKDGGVNVINRGYSTENNQWEEAVGKAYFVNSTNEAFLKVSFFGPFYGSYIVFELDDNYQYAFVSGPNTDYLWLLSRTPTIEPKLLEKFKTMAKDRGFMIENLILVKQSA